jgi:uncharacterized protein YceK
MKTLKKRIKHLSIALAILILLQGCTVYKKQSATMQVAVQEQVRTKVKTTNKNFSFRYITYENDNYYGVKKSNGELNKIRLDEGSIESIHLKNKPLSIFLTIILPVALFIAVVAVGHQSFSTGLGVAF